MKEAKRDALWAMLRAGGAVRVILDARVAGVDVPEEFRGAGVMGLDIGLDLPRPIRDLAVGGEEWSGTLSFRGRPHLVRVPWAAVMGFIRNDETVSFWSDGRVEVPRPAPDAPTPARPKRARPAWLRVIQGGA